MIFTTIMAIIAIQVTTGYFMLTSHTWWIVQMPRYKDGFFYAAWDLMAWPIMLRKVKKFKKTGTYINPPE